MFNKISKFNIFYFIILIGFYADAHARSRGALRRYINSLPEPYKTIVFWVIFTVFAIYFVYYMSQPATNKSNTRAN